MNVEADRGTFGELCVKDDAGTSCYTRSQLDSLLNGAGSVLGTSTHASNRNSRRRIRIGGN